VASNASVFAAEAVGTFALTFFGAGAILQTTSMGSAGFGLLGVALAHGIALSIAITATAAVSGGHINPAVTIALATAGKVSWPRVPLYVAAQIVGSAFGAFLLTRIFPPDVVASAGLGTPAPAPGVTFANVVFLEAILTFFLAFAVFGTAVDARAPKLGGFAIGLAVFVDILVGGPITGAAMNPARVLGPALVGGVWTMHAAYWIGPILGAVLAALLYKGLLEKV
jgi:MIP family channel proteins